MPVVPHEAARTQTTNKVQSHVKVNDVSLVTLVRQGGDTRRSASERRDVRIAQRDRVVGVGGGRLGIVANNDVVASRRRPTVACVVAHHRVVGTRADPMTRIRTDASILNSRRVIPGGVTNTGEGTRTRMDTASLRTNASVVSPSRIEIVGGITYSHIMGSRCVVGSAIRPDEDIHRACRTLTVCTGTDSHAAGRSAAVTDLHPDKYGICTSEGFADTKAHSGV